MKNNGWLIAMSLTLGALICGGGDWLSVLIGGLCGFLLLYIYKRTDRPVPGWCRFLQGIWCVLLLAVLGEKANALYPDAGNSYYIPGVLFGLSWLCARDGDEKLCACHAVLSCFVWVAVGVVALCAIPQMEWRWTLPHPGWQGAALGFSLAAGGMLLPGRPGKGWCLAGAVCPAILALLVCGSLSPQLAQKESLAFYTLSRSIRLFGVVERFEALVGAGLCIGLFGTMSLLLAGVRRGLTRKKGDAVTLLICVISVLITGKIQDVVTLGAIAGILYVILPFFQKKQKNA